MPSVRYAVQFAVVSVALSLLVSPVQAVTCDEVRSLGATEVSDWAKRLKVKPAELAALLELSFCEMTSERSRTIVTERKGKALTRVRSSL
jgi:hypothetical protein